MIKRLADRYLKWRIQRACNEKWQQIIRLNKAAGEDKATLTRYMEQWRPLGEKVRPHYPGLYGAISGIVSSSYVPEDIYYTRLEPTLNNRSFATAYADKNFYQKFLPEYGPLFPMTCLRCINGVLWNREYKRIKGHEEAEACFEEDKDYIFKPSVETSGGADVAVLRYSKGLFYFDREGGVTAAGLLQRLGRHKHFIIQDKIVQHPWFAGFNASSLNTVRVFTYRSVKDETVHLLSAVVRFGQPGSLVDNQAAGGLTCGISREGKLQDFACTKMGRARETPGPVVERAGQQVPEYERLVKYAREIAPAYSYHRLLGFDLCVDDKNEVKLLEINCKNIEINFLQMNNGPLFGELTQEVIDYCRINKKNITLDFTI